MLEQDMLFVGLAVSGGTRGRDAKEAWERIKKELEEAGMESTSSTNKQSTSCKHVKHENKIGPMICLSVKRVTEYAQKHSMLYYQILFPEAEMSATQLHAFKVVRNGEELYLPTHMLQPGDNVWIDQSAFMADGSFILKGKNKQSSTCLPVGTKVYPIEDIITTKEIIHFRVGTINIQASIGHPIYIMRGANSISVPASELRIGDMFKTDISFLSHGNYVLGSDGEGHKITKNNKR